MTVAELIEKLRTLPAQAKVQVRDEYDVRHWVDVEAAEPYLGGSQGPLVRII